MLVIALSQPTDFARARRPAGTRRLAALGLAAAACLSSAVPSRAVAQAPADGAEAQNVTVATGSGPLETAITVEMLQIEQGTGGAEIRRWVPATRLTAGDELHYTVRVRNPGKEPVTDVVVTKRLPFGVHYERGSATGPAAVVQFSIDGGRTFATPDEMARATGSGKNKKGARKPPVSDYTHVRWVLTRPLSPGATALLRFRATFS
jgi:uncharacterized repeat protein (TIGR01451 family)